MRRSSTGDWRKKHVRFATIIARRSKAVRQEREQFRDTAETARLASEEARIAAERARAAADEARAATDAARQAIVDAVRATADALNASIEQMRSGGGAAEGTPRSQGRRYDQLQLEQFSNLRSDELTN
jgi:hypothetical protein